MEKKKILSVIIVNIFVLAIALVGVNYSLRISNQTKFLNDDQVRVYNPKGFTTEQMRDFEQLAGVDDVYFDHRNLAPTFKLNTDDGTEITLTGDSIEEDNQAQKQLDYIAGSYLTDIYQVIITQTTADVLIEYGIGTDYQDLIGKEMVDGLKIVGVYPDNEIVTLRQAESQYILSNKNQTEFEEFIQYQDVNHGFMLFNRGHEYDAADLIENYNLDVANAYEQATYDHNQYIYNFNDSNPNNEYGYYINYQESVDAGAKDLIDPQTKAYGQDFNQYAFITTSGERDNVVKEISNVYPNAAIITNDTKLSDMRKVGSKWVLFVLIAILLELFIFVPMVKNSKK